MPHPRFDHVRFNPLPLPKQGEIPLDLLVLTRDFEFQSAPLAEARGDPSLWPSDTGPDCCFNPLPLPKQGEMSVMIRRLKKDVLFQSAPLAEARGDHGRTSD